MAVPNVGRGGNAQKQALYSIVQALAMFHAKRNTPLPPGLLGFPSPDYDPTTSPFKDLQPGPEVGSIHIAGKHINIYTLFSAVLSRGGATVLTTNDAWSILLPQFDLPDQHQTPDGSLVNVAQLLRHHYNLIFVPFEDIYRRNLHEKAQAMRQMNASSQPLRPGQSNMPIPRGPNGHLAQSTPNPNLMPPGPQTISSASMPRGPSLPRDPSVDRTPTDYEQDLHSAKRKLEFDESDGKRVRQKTEPFDPGFPAAPVTEPASVGSNNSVPSLPATSAMSSQPRPRHEPSRRKIEYVPLAREVDTYGGRDVKLIEGELFPQAQRRQLRDINDWGTIDIDALTMSLRSRLSTELSYSLTTLTLLSTMKGAQPNTGFRIMDCPELLDEVLDLLEDLAFSDEEDIFDLPAPYDDPHITTNRKLLNEVLNHEAEPFAGLQVRQGSKDPKSGGPQQRPGSLILAVLNIIRNLCIFLDNAEYIARHPRALDLLLRLCSETWNGTTVSPTSPAISLNDLIVIRKDTLHVLFYVAAVFHFVDGAAPSKTVLRLAKRIFFLISSYLVDPAEAVTPFASLQLVGTVIHRPPVLADIALEVFTRIGHSDTNRLVFAKAVPRASLKNLFVSLVHRLPVVDGDFQLLNREQWLSYIEKVVMALYALAFLSPPDLKERLKSDRSLGLKSIILRMVQKLAVHSTPELRSFFMISVRRAVETMKVLDDAKDSFDTSTATVTTLSFGMGYGEVGENDVETGTGLFGGHRDSTWDMMLLREVNMDEQLFSELDSLIRVEY
ncbi:hypothetical protein K435DRAFT_840873 [Dendrothele bispora CBS 962.96]|uniref:ARID domain-containing protein n=1 Tax=Dendrothele bispora (strain CBS 962.96) TaxID=1314807 RepID=A0A4S8LQN0_DENBC|nr:hypothetical protein K435DRAFT_840873 [Dendrothele bispora CBS 962.96]